MMFYMLMFQKKSMNLMLLMIIKKFIILLIDFIRVCRMNGLLMINGTLMQQNPEYMVMQKLGYRNLKKNLLKLLTILLWSLNARKQQIFIKRYW